MRTTANHIRTLWRFCIIRITKTIWISVEYRLAPEHKYPIWLEDACAAVEYILAHKTIYGTVNKAKFSSTSIVHSGVETAAKVGVVGTSAGAQIAASICHTVKHIDFQVPLFWSKLVQVVGYYFPQILFYGIFNMTGRTPSSYEFSDPMYFITPEALEQYVRGLHQIAIRFYWFHSIKRNAFRDEYDLVDPRVSVVFNSSFENIPSCLFVVAELDPLRDDSYGMDMTCAPEVHQMKRISFSLQGTAR